MKRLLLFILLGIGLVAGSILLSSCSSEEQDTASKESTEETQLWTCGMHPEVIMEEPGQCPICGMNLVPLKKQGANTGQEKTKAKTGGGERKVLYWQAPMNPTEIYDKPGKSAMGMDLIPVYEGEGGKSSGGVITIDPATVQNMGVRTQEVKRQVFSRIIRTVGNIDYNETKLYTVTTKISGWIEKLYVDYTGQAVRKGQPLLEIYSPELVTTQEEYLLALKNKRLVGESKFASIREGAESLLRSTRKRLEYWDIPARAIKRLEETGEVRKTITLVAPANGVVTHKNAVEGMKIGAGMNLYQIADLSTVWVYASVFDNEVPWVHEGQTAEMDLSYNPGKKYKGLVSYIYPYLNQKARDVRLRMEFSNPDLQLRPGMYANISLHADVVPNALVLPSEAVIRSGSRNIVFVAQTGGRFEPREVKIGEEGPEGEIRILAGVLEGERVVTSAQFMLDSESRLQEAIQKMLQEKRDRKESKVQTNVEKKSDSGMRDMQKTKDVKNKQPEQKTMDHSKMQADTDEKMNMENNSANHDNTTHEHDKN